jgi:hypothetical protein
LFRIGALPTPELTSTWFCPIVFDDSLKDRIRCRPCQGRLLRQSSRTVDSGKSTLHFSQSSLMTKFTFSAARRSYRSMSLWSLAWNSSTDSNSSSELRLASRPQHCGFLFSRLYTLVALLFQTNQHFITILLCIRCICKILWRLIIIQTSLWFLP